LTVVCYYERAEKEANNKKLEDFEQMRNKEALLRDELSRLLVITTFSRTSATNLGPSGSGLGLCEVLNSP